ncbi:hypothetical protein REC12_03255 [Desulfosporosinus sp. PR]|uniref:hypothetical protein n=1 Tax=Candidatus Desulfosporosinus nitrosoreducens TaxID=3401928 RepID=UPI0027F48C2C|nr:hypothetical protein [Desulfosporosinus sp. PR]MDQ7092598.1 hypothetical protein [Desulfosporosinus sp. PR]
MQTTVDIHCCGDAIDENELRERQFILSWIKQQLSRKTGQSEKEAFLAKHKYVLDYHGIKREEILD